MNQLPTEISEIRAARERSYVTVTRSIMTGISIHQVKYTYCYAFPYSLREKTRAHRRLEDTVPIEDKKRRANELLDVFRRNARTKFEE